MDLETKVFEKDNFSLFMQKAQPFEEGNPPQEGYMFVAYNLLNITEEHKQTLPHGLTDEHGAFIHVLRVAASPTARFSRKGLEKFGRTAIGITEEYVLAKQTEKIKVLDELRDKYLNDIKQKNEAGRNMALFYPIDNTCVDIDIKDLMKMQPYLATHDYKIPEAQDFYLVQHGINLYGDFVNNELIKQAVEMIPYVEKQVMRTYYGFNLKGITNRLKNKTLTTYFCAPESVRNFIIGNKDKEPLQLANSLF
ncbi:MAG: hypothetical protein AABW92_05285 [Nanoarchaeota archaeon]